MTRVIIDPEAKQKLDLYVGLAKGEISGLMGVYAYNGNLYIPEVYLLDQECTSSTTDLDSEAISKFILSLIQAGQDDVAENLRGWWHSHDKMGVFISGTDEETIQSFDNDWMLSLVLNKKGESLCRFDIFNPIHLKYEEVKLEVGYASPEKALIESVESEISSKVREKSYVKTYPSYRGISKWEKDEKGDWVETIYSSEKEFSAAERKELNKGNGYVDDWDMDDDEEYMAYMRERYES